MNSSQHQQIPHELPQNSSGRDSPATPDSEAEKIRREHLELETSVRSLGGLYCVFGLFLAVAAFESARFVGLGTPDRPHTDSYMLIIAILCGVLSLLGFIYGWGMLKLDKRIRIPVMVTACVVMFPLFVFARAQFGTFESAFATFVAALITAWVLTPLRNPKIHVVLSPEYQEVRRLTRHIEKRTSPVILICALLLLSLLGVAAIGAMFWKPPKTRVNFRPLIIEPRS